MRRVIMTSDGPVVSEKKDIVSVWARMKCLCEEPVDVDEKGKRSARCYECGYAVMPEVTK